jgi:hypothetical protein
MTNLVPQNQQGPTQMNSYETKQAARKDRLAARADRLQAEAED